MAEIVPKTGHQILITSFDKKYTYFVKSDMKQAQKFV